MKLYILMNLVFILLFSIFRFKQLSFKLRIWIAINIFLVPIFLLGEFWADYEIARRFQNFECNISEPLKKKKSLYFGDIYIAILYFFVCYTFNLENNFFVLLLIFGIYHFLNLGYFCYHLARSKSWTFLCIFSYIVAIYCYFN